MHLSHCTRFAITLLVCSPSVAETQKVSAFTERRPTHTPSKTGGTTWEGCFIVHHLFCLYLPLLTRQEHCRHFTHIQRAGKIMVITVLPANYWTHCSLLTMLKMRWQENWSSYMSLWLKGATDLSKCTNKVGIGSKVRNVFQEMSNNWFADGRKRTLSSYPQEKSIKPTFSLG